MEARDTQTLAETPAIQKRIRDDNIVPFRRGGKIVTAEEQAQDPRRGYALGLLLLDHRITERQHEAGKRFAEDMAKYYGLTGIPFPSARAQNLFAVKGESHDSESKAEAAKQAKHRMGLLRDALLSTGDIDTGRRVHHTVVCVTLQDIQESRVWPEHMHFWLRRGLNKLAVYYQLPEA